jgi:hypothetical protein
VLGKIYSSQNIKLLKFMDLTRPEQGVRVRLPEFQAIGKGK